MYFAKTGGGSDIEVGLELIPLVKLQAALVFLFADLKALVAAGAGSHRPASLQVFQFAK